MAAARRHYSYICDVFNLYASRSATDPFSLPVRAYQQLVAEAGILDPASKFCGRRDLDALFIQSTKDAEGRADPDLSNPDRSLVRFEFIELLLRVAVGKYQAVSPVAPRAKSHNPTDADSWLSMLAATSRCQSA
jgi:hypothetical protein